MKKLIIILGLVFLGHGLQAQVPAPGEKQADPILLMNGTAHLGNGEVIENAAIGFENGIITIVASSNVSQGKYKVIDIKGKHVYPGFILPATDLGLNEVSAVRATQDKSEAGRLKPNVRSIIAYNTDSEIIPTLRFNGICSDCS